MGSEVFCYELLLLGLLWLYVILAWAWPLARVLPGLPSPLRPFCHRVSALALLSHFLASSINPTVRPVSRQHKNQRSHALPRCRHRAPPAGDAPARSTPRPSSAPIPTVPIIPTVSPAKNSLVYFYIKILQRSSRMERPSRGGEKRTAVWASPHEERGSDGAVAPPMCAHRVVLHHGVVRREHQNLPLAPRSATGVSGVLP